MSSPEWLLEVWPKKHFINLSKESLQYFIHVVNPFFLKPVRVDSVVCNPELSNIRSIVYEIPSQKKTCETLTAFLRRLPSKNHGYLEILVGSYFHEVPVHSMKITINIYSDFPFSMETKNQK